MSLSERGSLPPEGTLANAECRNTRVKRAVRISSIVAQEVSTQPLEGPRGLRCSEVLLDEFQSLLVISA